MELRHIRYFLAVAEERHFTRAAAKVGIGQPPLSQQIKDLEAEIDITLFSRVAHGAELTAVGKAFLETVQRMPALAEQAKNFPSGVPGGRSAPCGRDSRRRRPKSSGTVRYPLVSPCLSRRGSVTGGGQHRPLVAGIARRGFGCSLPLSRRHRQRRSAAPSPLRRAPGRRPSVGPSHRGTSRNRTRDAEG
jgi:hypothetical protein